MEDANNDMCTLIDAGKRSRAQRGPQYYPCNCSVEWSMFDTQVSIAFGDVWRGTTVDTWKNTPLEDRRVRRTGVRTVFCGFEYTKYEIAGLIQTKFSAFVFSPELVSFVFDCAFLLAHSCA